MSEELEDRLRWRIRELQIENQRLKDELQQTESKLNAAEYRIEDELVPRIKADERRYDQWATSPERSF